MLHPLFRYRSLRNIMVSNLNPLEKWFGHTPVVTIQTNYVNGHSGSVQGWHGYFLQKVNLEAFKWVMDGISFADLSSIKCVAMETRNTGSKFYKGHIRCRSLKLGLYFISPCP